MADRRTREVQLILSARSSIDSALRHAADWEFSKSTCTRCHAHSGAAAHHRSFLWCYQSIDLFRSCISSKLLTAAFRFFLRPSSSRPESQIFLRNS